MTDIAAFTLLTISGGPVHVFEDAQRLGDPLAVPGVSSHRTYPCVPPLPRPQAGRSAWLLAACGPTQTGVRLVIAFSSDHHQM
jgi:hypothetical protein